MRTTILKAAVLAAGAVLALHVGLGLAGGWFVVVLQDVAIITVVEAGLWYRRRAREFARAADLHDDLVRIVELHQGPKPRPLTDHGKAYRR